MEPGRFDAISFDCYGTLIDWEAGLCAALAPWLARQGARVPADRLLAAFAAAEAAEERAHPRRRYPRILAGTLQRMGGALGLDVTDAEAAAFGASIPDWPAFDDAPAALARLRRQVPLAILSNVDGNSFAGSEERLGLSFDLVVTAEDVGAYKPDLTGFRRLLEALAERGIARERVLHAAQSLYHDIEPASALGLATVWVDRRHAAGGFGATAAPTADVRPTWRVTSLTELADAFDV